MLRVHRLSILTYLVLCIFSGKFAFSQPDSIWSQPGDNQVCSFLAWYHSSLYNKDSQTVITALTQAEKRFEQENNQPLRRQAWLLRRAYKAERETNLQQRAIIMLNAASEAEKKNLPLTQAECWHYTGYLYYHAGNYVKAFEFMQKAQAVFDRHINLAQNHYLYHYSNALGACYYHFGEYREAIKYLRRTADLPPWWKKIIYAPALYNNLALAYRQLKQYDSAVVWFEKSYESAAELKDDFYMALVQGNLGGTFFAQGQHEKALPLLEADFAGSRKAGETGSAINAALTLAEIYLVKGETKLAEKYIDYSRDYVFLDPHPIMLKAWYQNLYQLARAKSDHKNIAFYADSILAWQDSVAAMRDRKAFNQAVLRLEAEKHLNEVNQLQHQRKQQVLLRNSLVAVLALLVLIALLLLNRQLLKRRKEKELASQQLGFAQRELLNYTEQLSEKNALLEQLREKLNRNDYLSDREGHLSTLLEATILTEEDWKKFRQLFEKVYPGFFVRLRERIPDLSASDIRLLALTKLQLSPRNMSFMLGVTYDAVKKARQRLRKKINLPEEGTLEELVEAINA